MVAFRFINLWYSYSLLHSCTTTYGCIDKQFQQEIIPAGALRYQTERDAIEELAGVHAVI